MVILDTSCFFASGAIGCDGLGAMNSFMLPSKLFVAYAYSIASRAVSLSFDYFAQS